MITQEQADTAQRFHFTANPQRPCGGPRSNTFRRTGKTKRWKRQPEQFSVPAKYGLWESIRITNENAVNFHAEEDCPANAT